MIDVAFYRIAIVFVIKTVYLSQSTSLQFNSTSLDIKAHCQLYCSSDILHYVWVNNIFNNSNYFNNMKRKRTSSVIEEDFLKLLNSSNENPSKDLLRTFVDSNFEYSNDLKQFSIPADINDSPKIVDNVYDWDLRNIVIKLNKKWSDRGSKVNESVSYNGSLYSQIYLPKPFIINNNDFGDFFIWNYFLTLESLIASEMLSTAKNMVMNMLYIVDQYGYIPINSNKYFIERPYLPILIPIFELYITAVDDEKFLYDNIHILEREFSFWMDTRYKSFTIENMSYNLFLDAVNMSYPRADCIGTAFGDFEKNMSRSSKNIPKLLKDSFSLYEFETSNLENVASVELNALMAYNAKLLSTFYKKLGNDTEARRLEELCDAMNRTISRIFWNDDEGLWFDYNANTESHIKEFYFSNLFPFWLDLFGKERDKTYVIERVINYIKNKEINHCEEMNISLLNKLRLKSLNHWAPFYYLINRGLVNAGKYRRDANQLAFLLANNYVLTYFNVFKRRDYVGVGVSKNLFDVGSVSWEDDLVVKFLSLYGHQIWVTDTEDPIPLSIGIILWIVGIAAVVSYIYRIRRCNSVKDLKYAQHIPLVDR